MSIVVAICASYAMTTSVASEHSYDPRYDARVVYDLSHLSVSELLKDTEGTWIILEAMPAEYSGASVRIDTSYSYDEEAGQFVQHGAGKRGIEKRGMWKALARLNGDSGQSEGQYRWVEPNEPAFRPPFSPSHLYRPFEEGGKVLCARRSEPPDGIEFMPCYLIPPTWTERVTEAYKYFKNHRRAFREPRGHAARSLETAVREANPAVGIVALSYAEPLSESVIRVVEGRAERYQLAALVYRLLSEQRAVSRVDQMINEAVDARALDGVAVGIYLWDRTEFVTPELENLLMSLRAKLATFDRSDDSVRYGHAVLAAMGLPTGATSVEGE